MVLGVANNLNAAAAGDDDIALGHALGSVVGAFGMNVRPQKLDQVANVKAVKNSDCIHILERCQDLRPLVARNVRTPRAFQRERASIRIHGDHQAASQLLGRMQITDVAYVQQVKATVGQDDFLARSAPLPDNLGKLREPEDLLRCLRQSALHHGPQQFRLGYGRGAALHHHNSSGVIGELGGGFGIGPGS